MSRISVAIITHNSEDLIGQCLESVHWADEVIVVDGESTDSTVKICGDHPRVKVFVVPNDPNLDVNKNIAIDHCTGEWVLVLDCDEVITPGLAVELRYVAENGLTDSPGYFIPRRNLFLRRWMKASGWYPDHVLRFFLKGKGRFDCVHVHERLTLDGKPGYLKNDMLHYTYRSFREYFEKMDRYTSFEAKYRLGLSEGNDGPSFLEILKHGSKTRPFLRKMWWKYTPLKPVFRFFLVFIARKGFLDGRHGLTLAVLSGVSDFISNQKYHMLKNVKEGDRGTDVEFIESGRRS